MKKVLYLSYDGLTDNLGQSQVLPYLIGLSKKGNRFHVISFEKENRFKQLKGKIQAICEEHDIEWHPQFYTKTPPVLSTIKDIALMRRLAKKIHKKERFNIVHCRSYIPGMVGMHLKKKYKVKFLFDMRGFWADERVEGKIWDIKKPLYKFIYRYFKKKETKLFNNADHVVSLTNKGKEIILSNNKWKIDENKISVIPCCVDLDLFDPKNINDVAKENLQRALNISQKNTVLGYVGSIGTWYMLEEMLDFFKEQLQKNKQLLFLFITQESCDYIYKKAKEKDIPKSSIRIASSTHNYVPLHISLFDYSIFFIRPNYSKQASSPTKQGELMAMGVPIICNSGVGDTDTIVHKYQSGIVLEELTKKAYYCINLEDFNFDAAMIRNGAKKVFSLEDGVNKYESIYIGK